MTPNWFSQRHGLETPGASTVARKSVPRELRGLLLSHLTHHMSGTAASFVGEVLGSPPRAHDTKRMNEEMYRLTYRCKWYQVFDVIEALYRCQKDKKRFQDWINRELLRYGLKCWRMKRGKIEPEIPGELQDKVQDASNTLDQAGLLSIKGRLDLARRALSVRPDPDTKGAISHATAALEGLVCEVLSSCGTLGDLVKRLDIPQPLVSAIEKLWGYASQYGRHENPNRAPTLEDARLVLGLCALFISYLPEKYKDRLREPRAGGA